MPQDASEFLQDGFSRETSIRRDANGNWYYENEAITHQGVREAFNRWIDHSPDGRYCLRNAIHWVYVAIEGPPFFVRSVHRADPFVITLSGGESENLDFSTLRQDVEGRLYCSVRNRTFAALFTSQALMFFAEYLHEDSEGIYLQIAETRFRPPIVDAPLAVNTHVL